MFSSHCRNRNLKRRPNLEMLEGRQLMSLGAEFMVNPAVQGSKVDSANASSANGSSVVVWQDNSAQYPKNSSDFDIKAQRFDSSGAKVGPAFFVAGKVNVPEIDPSVAMDAHGDFVVSWTELEASGDSNVLAQKFNASGVPIGGIVPVGVGTFQESESSVAMDAAGNFVVTYTRNTNNDQLDVFAKRYNASSQLLGVITVSASASAEMNPSIAMSPDGRFDIAYQYQLTSTDVGVYTARYSAAGGLLGVGLVATGTDRYSPPSISMDNAGNAVVAYEELYNVFYAKGGFSTTDSVDARRITSTGVFSAAIVIQGPSSTAPAFDAAVALAPNSGEFVVAYYNGYGVAVSMVDNANVIYESVGAGLGRWQPAISINDANRFFVTYGSTTDIDPTVNSNILGRFGSV